MTGSRLGWSVPCDPGDRHCAVLKSQREQVTDRAGVTGREDRLGGVHLTDRLASSLVLDGEVDHQEHVARPDAGLPEVLMGDGIQSPRTPATGERGRSCAGEKSHRRRDEQIR